MPSESKSEKRRKRQAENVWELFNKPVDFNMILNFLNQDLTDVFSDSDPRLMPNLDRQAEELIERAGALAEKEGISIEEALSHYGIRLEDGREANPDTAAEELKDTMLKSLDWEVTQADEEGKSAEAIGRESKEELVVLNKFRECFSLYEDELVDEINGRDGRVVRKIRKKSCKTPRHSGN